MHRPIYAHFVNLERTKKEKVDFSISTAEIIREETLSDEVNDIFTISKADLEEVDFENDESVLIAKMDELVKKKKDIKRMFMEIFLEEKNISISLKKRLVKQLKEVVLEIAELKKRIEN